MADGYLADIQDDIMNYLLDRDILAQQNESDQLIS